MGTAIQNALSLIINTAFDFFLFVILLRFLLQLVRADFQNPLSQFVVKLTSPILRPLRRIIPSWGGMDMASLLLAFLVAFIKNGLLMSVVLGLTPHPLGLAIISLANIIETVIFIYVLAIIAQIIISWISAGQYNPLSPILFQLTEPLMVDLRRIFPPVAGFDLTPIPVLIGLRLIHILVVETLITFGTQFLLG